MVPNEVLQGLDSLERKFVLGLSAFGLGLSALFIFVRQTGYKTMAMYRAGQPAGAARWTKHNV